MKKITFFLLMILVNVALVQSQNTFIKTYNGYGEGFAAKQTSDSGYIAVGNNNNDFHILKTDSLGITTWSQVFGGNYFETLRDVLQTFDGGFVAVGYTPNFGAGVNDVFMVK